jgi:hypothetical protein
MKLADIGDRVEARDLLAQLAVLWKETAPASCMVAFRTEGRIHLRGGWATLRYAFRARRRGSEAVYTEK